jgi:hypothetical protein
VITASNGHVAVVGLLLGVKGVKANEAHKTAPPPSTLGGGVTPPGRGGRSVGVVSPVWHGASDRREAGAHGGRGAVPLMWSPLLTPGPVGHKLLAPPLLFRPPWPLEYFRRLEENSGLLHVGLPY